MVSRPVLGGTPQALWGAQLGLSSNTPAQPVRLRSDSMLGVNPFRIAFLCILLLILSVAGANRLLGWGRDFGEYYLFYDTVTPYFGWGYSRFESGYELSAFVFANYINASFPVFYFFLVAIALSLKFFTLWRHSASPILAAAVYCMLLYPIHEYTQIRAAVSIGLAYLGIHFMLEGKIRWAIALMAIAFTFHSSIILVAAVAFGAYYIPIRIAALGLLVLGLASVLMYNELATLITTYFSAFNPLVDKYVFNSEGNVAINIFSGSNVLYMLVALGALASGLLQRDKYHSVFLTMLLTSFLTLVVFRESPVLALRTTEMLNVAALFLVFRLPLTARTAPLQLLMLLNGFWTTYRAVAEGTLGG